MPDEIRWLAVLKRLSLFILTFAAISAIAITPLITVLSTWTEVYPTIARLYGDIAGAIAIVCATWVMTRFADKRPFLTIGFARKNAIRDLFSGLAIGAAWLGISVGILMAAGWASPQAVSGFSIALLFVAAVSVLFNVLTQQLLICGYILQTVRAKAGMPIAILASAVLFSVLHAAAFGGAWIPPFNVFGAGLVFCLAYAVTGNLWLPIAIHFAWNMLLGPVLGLTISGTGALGLGWDVFEVVGPEKFTGGAFGIEGGLIVTLTTAILAMLLTMIYARQGASQRGRSIGVPS